MKQLEIFHTHLNDKGTTEAALQTLCFWGRQKDLGQRVRAKPRSKENQSRTAVKAIKTYFIWDQHHMSSSCVVGEGS